MRRLDWYVLKELAVPLLTGTVVFALLFVANDMIRMFKEFNLSAVPGQAIAQLLIFKFPTWLSVTFPIGCSLGVALAVSRLARESEVTAMKAAGISVRRIFRPLIVTGFIMAVLNFWMIERVVPPTSKAWRKLINEVGILASIPTFRSNVMLSIDRFSASFGSVQRGENGLVMLTDVLLIERPRPGEVTLYKADRGTFRDGIWTIAAPTSYNLRGTILQATETKTELKINEPIRIVDLFTTPQPEEETTSSLLSSINKSRELRQSTTMLEVALHQKFSVPAACLVFAFTSAVLAVRFARAGPFIGVMISLGVVWLYFNAYIISGEIFGRNGWLSPFLAAWTPNVVFGMAGLLFVRRLE